MAITINGSGSITGISAGGLPDGSVTAADLADTYLTPTGDGGGNSAYWSETLTSIWLDSPSTTSATIYKCQYFGITNSFFSINRTAGDRDAAGADARTVSTITLMEIGA